jgi:metal-sulfur cluster biosynthetic enzyme
MTGPDAAALRAALGEVYDPCSQSWNRPLSLLDLGLVREVAAGEDGTAQVRISLTAPFCMAVVTIMQAVEQRLGEVPGVTGVHVDIDATTAWSPELMTTPARRALDERRRSDLHRPEGNP